VGRTSTVEDFVRANRELLKYIEKSGSSVGQVKDRHDLPASGG
jgi:hypothetical protein